MRAILLALLLAGCGALTVKQQLAATADTILQFTARTDRLCTGPSPLLSRSECLDRIGVAERAQGALNVANDLQKNCSAPCDKAEAALAAAFAAGLELETYVYRRRP